MEYTTLPSTDISVSRLCFGCWGITGDAHWGERIEAESIAAMSAAIDAGVNFFDTAPMYADGASELLLGRFLADRGLRSQVVVASKIRPNRMRAAEVIAECEESLTRLQTDYLDLYQTHWANPDVPLVEAWDAMLQLQQQGKVRQIGVCNAGPADLQSVSERQKPVTNQVPYNLLWRLIEPEILPKCIQDDIGILPYSPLFQGMLADKYQSASDVPDNRARSRHFNSARPNTRHGEPGCERETFAAVDRIREIAAAENRTMAAVSLAWLAQQPGVTSIIAGARNAEQFAQNLKYLDAPLSDDVLKQLNDATSELMRALGSNPDMWDGAANSRYH